MIYDEGVPILATRLSEVQWFEDALAASQDEVIRTPKEFWPAWFRKYHPDEDYDEVRAAERERNRTSDDPGSGS